ncbi:(d)CMP kinase [Ferroacidibacillus organovorans]|uniref:(d)CMP kinase n=1 Tax=Ferroacidibacillus organovorans TaxID=1765683 RepID=UPI000ABD863B|nr:(d)CMP kinase [Ferroacidibacillus organovorans]
MKIALDGPAGAGKSTVAKEVAKRLQMTYVDSGAMYRCVTYLAIKRHVTMQDETGLSNLANAMQLMFIPSEHGQVVHLDGVDVTDAIRSSEVGALVPLVAKHARVRECLVEKQREMARTAHSVVMDGRDIGTHVLPDAVVKVYLTATLDVRARRRHEELVRQGFTGSVADVMKLLHERDEIDGRREIAPMRPASDAVVLDTSCLAIHEVTAMVVSLCQARMHNEVRH